MVLRENRTVWLVALTTIVAVACATPAAIAIPPGGPGTESHGAKVKLDRKRVAQGGRIKVTGTKWKAKRSRTSGKAEVTVKLDDRDILAVIPIKSKRFSGWVRIPAPVKAGRHWLRFLASDPATSVKSATFTVTKR